MKNNDKQNTKSVKEQANLNKTKTINKIKEDKSNNTPSTNQSVSDSELDNIVGGFGSWRVSKM